MFPQIFGKYVLEREIAAGGMARVYLATLRGAVGFEKRLVVKQIRPELASDDAFVRRFVEEAKTAVELGHPNIVPVYELGVEQGIYYIAMELCEGATLAELFAETGPLSPEEGAYVGVEICRALDYAHRRASIVHRDVTPRNVMIDDEGAVRLIDFGIAAPATNENEKHRRTEVFGSPGHMPPEQLQGARLTPATDVFAVGALLIEAWTGTPPFRRATAADSERALGEPPPPLGEHDPQLAGLDALIASTVALDPAARPARAELLARPLRDFVKSADLGDVARRLGERVRRARQRTHTSSPWLPGEGLTGAGATPTSSTPRGPATPPLAHTPPARDGTPPGPVTRTFAARDDIVEWTRRLPEVETGDPAEPSPPSRDDEASPITAAIVGGAAAPDPSRAASRWRVVAAGLAGMVIAGVVSVRWLGGAKSPAASSATSAAALAAPARPDARRGPGGAPSALAAGMPPASASTAPPPAPASAAARFRAGPATSPSHGASTSERPQGRCTLSLTSQPPARVSVGSRSFASTPVVGLQLPPGRYAVTFQSLGVLDERVSATVTLEAGQARGVHADFTSASPRVILR